MSREKQNDELVQMYRDLGEIFDEEYEKRRLITPQNTAEKLTAKGYRKQSEVIKEFVERLHSELRVYGVNDKFNKGKFLTVVDDVAKKMKGGAE